jgi:peptidoglycan hydrolase CwlO-like protein
MKNLKTTPQQMIDECLANIVTLNGYIADQQKLIDQNNEDITVYLANITILQNLIVTRQNNNVERNAQIGALNDRIGIENDIINYINSLPKK